MIWAETTYQSLSEGADLDSQAELARTIDPLLHNLRWDLAAELRASSSSLADKNSNPTVLETQRRQTDSSIRELSDLRLQLEDVPLKVKASLMPFAVALEQFALQQIRERIDQRSIDGAEVIAAFTPLIGIGVAAEFQARQVHEGSLVTKTQPLSMLIQITQAIYLEDTVMSQALPSGSMTQEQRVAFVTPLGLQRSLLGVLPTVQSPAQQAALAKVTKSAAWTRMTEIENYVTTLSLTEEDNRDLSRLSASWRSALDKVEAELEETVRIETNRLVSSQADAARSTLLREGSISLVGLIAVLFSAALAWRVSRSLLRRMAALREATLELAEIRLPHVVARLNQGETVDVEAEALELDYGTDQVGQVAQAFNAVQRTGIGSAVALADARRGFQNAILFTARRSQSLINGQLALLDEFEHKYHDPAVLKDLYLLDSKASQLRRYEENLVIMSGGWPGRRWNTPVLLADVLRSAVGEVSEYQRITVSANHLVRLAGHAVADTVHLLAELIENAAKYSPSKCPVMVRGNTVGKGFAVEIEDQGAGMTAHEYNAVNQRLAKAPQFNVLAMGDDARLGTFVIARLANRHGIKITLRESAFGGTCAIVLIPEVLIDRDPAQDGGAPQVPVPTDVAAVEPSALPSELAEAVTGPPPHPPTEESLLISPGVIPSATATATHMSTSGLTPLPTRVPQASLVQELRHEPGSQAHQRLAQARHTSAEQAARSMSAFQRGTMQARQPGTRPPHQGR